MNEKKKMLSEGPITKNLRSVSYDIKDGRIRARVTVTLCNGTRKRLQGQGKLLQYQMILIFQAWYMLRTLQVAQLQQTTQLEDG